MEAVAKPLVFTQIQRNCSPIFFAKHISGKIISRCRLASEQVIHPKQVTPNPSDVNALLKRQQIIGAEFMTFFVLSVLLFPCAVPCIVFYKSLQKLMGESAGVIALFFGILFGTTLFSSVEMLVKSRINARKLRRLGIDTHDPKSFENI